MISVLSPHYETQTSLYLSLINSENHSLFYKSHSFIILKQKFLYFFGSVRFIGSIKKKKKGKTVLLQFRDYCCVQVQFVPFLGTRSFSLCSGHEAAGMSTIYLSQQEKFEFICFQDKTDILSLSHRWECGKKVQISVLGINTSSLPLEMQAQRQGSTWQPHSILGSCHACCRNPNKCVCYKNL